MQGSRLLIRWSLVRFQPGKPSLAKSAIDPMPPLASVRYRAIRYRAFVA